MPMYNLIEFSYIYSEREEPALEISGRIVDFTSNSSSVSIKPKEKITGQTENDGTEDFEIMLPLKYPSNFRRVIEMPLTNCKINLILNWSLNCFLVAGTLANQVSTIRITDPRLYIPLVILLIQDYAKLPEKLQSAFLREQLIGININEKYQ